MKKQQNFFGSAAESIIYPILLELLLLIVWWAEHIFAGHLLQYGLKPQQWSHWYGVLTMPLLHDPKDWAHILNNSIPLLFLTAALFYYYRQIAWKVLAVSWIGTGLLTLIFANPGSTHIGISGVLYALFGFLFVSGFFKNFRPLQVLSLMVGFIYGSMIWGIFPHEEGISWEGHLSGLLIGVTLAVVYRKHGPAPVKYQYEIEKELGIEPPDLEGEWNARQEALRLMQEEMIRKQQEALHIVYHIKPSDPTSEANKPADDNGN